MDPVPLIHFYIRKGWYQHVQVLSEEHLNKRGYDANVIFWRNYAIILEESYSEAIREFESLRKKRDVEFACMAALIYTHKQCKLVDHDEVAELEAMMSAAEDRASESGLLVVSVSEPQRFFSPMSGSIRSSDKENNTAQRIVSRICDGVVSPQTPTQHKAMILHGWIDLTSSLASKKDAEKRSNAINYFERSSGQDDPERLLGMAKYYELNKSFTQALEYLDEIIVKFPWFVPALSEKASILLKTGDWDQSTETATRAISANKDDIEARRLMILYLTTREGKFKEASEYLEDILNALDRTESRNPKIYYDVAKTNARISDRDPTFLKANMSIIDRAIRLRPAEGAYKAEKAYQYALQDNFEQAIELYKEALTVEESNEKALYGLIYCQIMTNQLQDATQQMEFLTLMQETTGAQPELLFIEALLAWKKDKNVDKKIQLLQKAAKLHMDRLKDLVESNVVDLSSYGLMVYLNPIFLVDVAKELLQHLAVEPGSGPIGTKIPAHVVQGISMVEKVIKKCPGFLNTQIMLAMARFDMQDIESATQLVSLILNMDPGNASAHLLMARISLRKEHFRAASSSLDQALSYDFSTRHSPIYHLVKSKVLESSGEIEEALEILEGALKLPGVRKPVVATGGGTTAAKAAKNPVSIYDRASVFIELAAMYAQLNRVKNAMEIVQEALILFRNTSEEVRILVANSELAIKRNDFDAAIAMLSGVEPDSSAYVKAQMVKANIFLQHRRDKTLYVKCFQDLAKQQGTTESYINLGEAYLKIQMPSDAIQSFEMALEQNPDDYMLARRIGETLILTHDYRRAIDYYENALRQVPDRTSIRNDLVELYLRMNQLERAQKIVQEAPIREPTDIHQRIEDVKILLLVATIQKKVGNPDSQMNALEKAFEAEKQVVEMIRQAQPELLAEQKKVMTRISCEMARAFQDKKDHEGALKHYNLALRVDESNEEAIAELAALYMKMGDLENCQMQCSTLMRLNPSNEECVIMLADIMFQKADFESAIYHFKMLLDKKCNNFVALHKFIIMLRRAGKLNECEEYLKKVENSNLKHASSPGFFYCQGLYLYYKNKVFDAVMELNKARRDGEWGTMALFLMIEIYINPDKENLWERTELSKKQEENIKIAQSLFNEVPQNQLGSLRARVLEAYIELSMKSKTSVEKAIEILLVVMGNEPEHVPAILALAICYMLVEQESKARNQLKRIAKMNYEYQYAEEFETSYLLLADIYIQRSKYDLSQELCKKSLAHNRSSGKAWEMMGLIMEKEKSYVDAAECYEHAWDLEGQASASIGFKLAFNFLKGKKIVETIDVCNKVLSMYPDYPKMKEEILQAAYEAMRP